MLTIKIIQDGVTTISESETLRFMTIHPANTAK